MEIDVQVEMEVHVPHLASTDTQGGRLLSISGPGSEFQLLMGSPLTPQFKVASLYLVELESPGYSLLGLLF